MLSGRPGKYRSSGRQLGPPTYIQDTRHHILHASHIPSPNNLNLSVLMVSQRHGPKLLDTHLTQWYALKLSEAQGEINILKTLRRRPLQQVVDCCTEGDPFPTPGDFEAADLNAVFARYSLHAGQPTNDLDERLTCEAVLVEISYVAGSHFLR